MNPDEKNEQVPVEEQATPQLSQAQQNAELQRRFMAHAQAIAVRNGWTLRKAKRYLETTQRKKFDKFIKGVKAKIAAGVVKVEGKDEVVVGLNEAQTNGENIEPNS